jgi:hypothetical protein
MLNSISRNLRFALVLVFAFMMVGGSVRVLAAGAYIVQGATITNIMSTNGNGDAFAIITSGGSGSCANTEVYFPQSAAPDADTFKRAYAAALTAITTGMRVSIYNYTDSTCLTASYVQIYP